MGTIDAVRGDAPVASPKRVFQAGAFEVVFEQDPMRSAGAIRFPRLKRWTQPWQAALQSIPGWSTVIGTTAIAIGIAWVSYYPEIMVLYGASFVIALLGLLRLRRNDLQVGLRGWLLLGMGLCLAGGTAVLSRVPSFRRALAFNHSAARGAQIAFADGRVRRLFGREIYRPEFSSIHGPLEAFPRQVVQDLFAGHVVPGAIEVTSFPADDKDYSHYAAAVGSYLPEFPLNRLNATTLAHLAESERLILPVIQITGKIEPKDVAFLSRRDIFIYSLVLINADADSIQMLEGLPHSGKYARRIVLVDCEWDLPAAKSLDAWGEAALVIRKTGSAGQHRLTLEELDALVKTRCNVEAIHTPTIDGEQAERLAKIPSLTTLSAMLLDDRAVEALKNSNLSSVQLKDLTESVAESLLSYPALNFVFADAMRIDGSWASRLNELASPGPKGRILNIRIKSLETDQAGFMLFQMYRNTMKYDAVQLRNYDGVSR
ncbi:MAG: hypothetical protein ACK5OB_02855 [Pirellula sp.]